MAGRLLVRHHRGARGFVAAHPALHSGHNYRVCAHPHLPIGGRKPERPPAKIVHRYGWVTGRTDAMPMIFSERVTIGVLLPA